MQNVNLHLRSGEQDADIWLIALTIPVENIKKLALCPLKWIRFVAFAIVGARGHLRTSPKGDLVDYETGFDSLADDYYYVPREPLFLVDPAVVGDHVTSTAKTERGRRFRSDIVGRDHACIFTRTDAVVCETAHIIPVCMSDAYVEGLVKGRSHAYDCLPDVTLAQLEYGINSIQNGLLLTADLHKYFGHGFVGFLMTPNFALDPSDIPREPAEAALPMPAMRLTLQHLHPIEGDFVVPQVNSRSPTTDPLAKPLNIFLDFMYGAACYQQWGRPESFGQVLKKNSDDHFQYLKVREALPPDEDSDGPDNSDDPAVSPNSLERLRNPKGAKKRKEDRDVVSEEMINSMNSLVALSHFLTGITPQEAAAERQRREEEKLLREQRAGAQKASRWVEEMFPSTNNSSSS